MKKSRFQSDDSAFSGRPLYLTNTPFSKSSLNGQEHRENVPGLFFSLRQVIVFMIVEGIILIPLSLHLVGIL